VKRVAFHPEAEAEFVAAAQFYEAQSLGLGRDFIAEVQRATRALVTYPRVGRQFSRKASPSARPAVSLRPAFEIESDDVLVVAVAHVRRRPGYWRGR
jgi:plasmid stabilization system protein ParE